jgi:cytochrome b pre-mRNA-processing protein 3
VEKRVLFSWQTRGRDRRTAEELYGAIVTQARHPAFFAAMGVEDTPEGRVGTIILHVYLVLDRLSQEGAAGRSLGRSLAEAFVTDIDDCLREMGVGDLSVPKQVKRLAAALYERSHAYRRLLDAGDEGTLASELAKTLPGLESNREGALRLAQYMMQARSLLCTAHGLPLGVVTFPAPVGTAAKQRGGLEGRP